MAANLTGGHLDVLLLQRTEKIHGGQAPGSELERVHPDPHAEVLGAHDFDLGDTVHSSQHVLDPGGGVVGDIEFVEGAVGRDHVDHEGDVGGLLFNLDTLSFGFLGEHRQCFVDPVLDEHRGHVDIGADLEGHGDGAAPVRR